MIENKFPAGWDDARIRGVIAAYEAMSDDELAAEDDATCEPRPGHTLVAVPQHLLPAVRELLAADGR